MRTFATDDGHVVVRLDTGDLLLESVREACADHGVHTGAVVSAIGTLRNLNVHYLHTDDLEQEQADRNTMLELDGCWEVTAVEGLIADGDPHLHVTAFDGERTVAGHLEEGNEVNALGEVLIRDLEGLELTRRPNEHGVSTLERE
ncbi:MAG: PPC domain-containing DNA-binding protein [Halobacteriaceae archaeon]